MEHVHPPPTSVLGTHITPRWEVPSILTRLSNPPLPDRFHRHTVADHPRIHWGIFCKIPTNLKQPMPLQVWGATPNGTSRPDLLPMLRHSKVSTHPPTHKLHLPLTCLWDKGRWSGARRLPHGFPSLCKATPNRANTRGARARRFWVGERAQRGLHTR
jgi:hypothetical protein